VRDTPRYPRWSRRWINHKLENPWVLYPVCGTIAFITVLLVADLVLNRSSVQKPPPALLRTVKVASSPEGADVFFDKDSDPQPKKTNAVFEIEPGEHTVRVKLEGYATESRPVDVPADGSGVPSVTFELKRSPVTPPTTASPRGTSRPPATYKPVEPMPVTRTLRVESDPGPATIILNDQVKGQTPKDFDLPPGKYTVRLQGEKYKDWERTVELTPGREPFKLAATLERQRDPSSFALLVGVHNAADSLPVFRHAPADIAELGRTLLSAGYPEGNVTVLAQLPKSPADKLPTAERVRRAVDALVRDRIPGDTVLLALAGPAVVAPGSTTSYFCPAGADPVQPETLVSLDEILQKLAACPARTKLVLIDGNRVGPPSPARPLAAKPENLGVAGVTMLTATADGAPGYVHAVDRHGVFWNSVLSALRDDAQGDDHKVTLGKLAASVVAETRKYVTETYNAGQTPKLVPATARDSTAVVATPDPALQCLRQGDALMKKKEYAKAAEQYGQAVALRMDLVEAYLRRAVAYYYLENFDGTIADCTEALRLDPGNAEAYDYRGDAHFAKAGKVPDMNLAEVNLALQDYSKSIELDPDCAPVFNSRSAARGSLSQVYYLKKETDKGKFEDEQAVEDSSRAIDLAPKPRYVYFETRARAYKRLDNFDRSADDYAAALQTGEPLTKRVSFRLHYNRGVVLFQAKDFARAEEAFDKAAKVMPGDPDPLLHRADALEALGRKGDAQKLRDDAAKLKRRPAA
jgi:tetratricopeptide (TPR) repeat protein